MMREHAPEDYGLVASKAKAWIDCITLNLELSALQKMPQPWFATTMGPLGVFCSCILAEPSSQILVDAIEAKPSITDLFMTANLSEILEELDETTCLHMMDLLGEVCMDHIGEHHFRPGRKFKYPTALPLVNAPTLITFINDVSPERARYYMEHAVTQRASSRPYAASSWTDEQLITIRLIHALMLKTDPVAFSVINSFEDPGFFDVDAAIQIIDTAQRLTGGISDQPTA